MEMVKSGNSPQKNNESQTKTSLNLTSNALKVLEKRYLQKDASGNVIETPEEMFRRVARAIAEADLQYDPSKETGELEKQFYSIMTNLEFLPNSPTLMNAGTDIGQLSACFVLPVEDSIEQIFDSVKYTAMIHKTGGGTGFSFSRLRPKSDSVKTTGGVASGPVSFMKVFDAATEEIKQGGRRRGANMGMLRVDHPDIVEFITCKKDGKILQNFNISVSVSDRFMEAVKTSDRYSLINPRNNEETEKLDARTVFDLIVENSWQNGDPGMVFIDRVNRSNPTPKLGEIESTNPCGEQPLLPFESCNLGSINLAKFVSDGSIEYDRLKYVIHLSVHFLDNVIDVNKYPIPQIEETTKKNRKIGLGIMGFADMLIKLKIKYDSQEALSVAEEIMDFIDEEAKTASEDLATKRGTFPNFEGSIYDKPNGRMLRNATVTTIAPTGTLSLIANCSSGIEPLFAVAYVRRVLEGEILVEVNPLFREMAKDGGYFSEELMKRIAKTGSIRNVKEIPEDVQQLFVTAHDITPGWHIRMQGAFQNHVDNAVSKTVNFPHDAEKEDVKEAYLLAYELGCKGVTVYRDRSRDVQVLTKGTTTTPLSPKIVPRPRPAVTAGQTIKVPTGCGTLYITINEDEHGPCEVFSAMGKAGGCAASQLEATSRLISYALRSGISPEAIVKQLRGIRCPSPFIGRGKIILSCGDAIGKTIESFLLREKPVDSVLMKEATTLDHFYEGPEMEEDDDTAFLNNVIGVCPDCGGALIHEEGCVVCKICGYTKCS
jgi:ribonucleoside-diphosphate reductase alpha chain